MMEISPGCNYLVTYSYDDHSIVGWNNDKVEGQLKPDQFINTGDKFVTQMCVSDDKKLAYVDIERKSLRE
jgi:hypothetical protein